MPQAGTCCKCAATPCQPALHAQSMCGLMQPAHAHFIGCVWACAKHVAALTFSFCCAQWHPCLAMKA